MFESLWNLLNATTKTKSILELLIISALGLFFVFWYKLEIIPDLLDKFSSRELTRLRELVKEEVTTGKIPGVLQDKIDLLSFKYAHKINAEKYLREAMIDIHESAKGRLRYFEIKTAKRFLSVGEDGKIEVKKFNKFDRFTYKCSSLFSFILWLMVIFVWIGLIVPPHQEFLFEIAVFLETLGLLFIAIQVGSIDGAVSAANKIRCEIDRRNKADQKS
jgi:hypothetical protein